MDLELEQLPEKLSRSLRKSAPSLDSFWAQRGAANANKNERKKNRRIVTPLVAIAPAAVRMKDGCDTPGVFTDVGFGLDRIEIGCEQVPDSI
jgi:hypothetical protein